MGLLQYDKLRSYKKHTVMNNNRNAVGAGTMSILVALANGRHLAERILNGVVADCDVYGRCDDDGCIVGVHERVIDHSDIPAGITDVWHMRVTARSSCSHDAGTQARQIYG